MFCFLGFHKFSRKGWKRLEDGYVDMEVDICEKCLKVRLREDYEIDDNISDERGDKHLPEDRTGRDGE